MFPAHLLRPMAARIHPRFWPYGRHDGLRHRREIGPFRNSSHLSIEVLMLLTSLSGKFADCPELSNMTTSPCPEKNSATFSSTSNDDGSELHLTSAVPNSHPPCV